MVVLKSDSPEMTVTEVANDASGVRHVWCVWFDQKKAKQTEALPLGTVIKYA